MKEEMALPPAGTSPPPSGQGQVEDPSVPVECSQKRAALSPQGHCTLWHKASFTFELSLVLLIFVKYASMNTARLPFLLVDYIGNIVTWFKIRVNKKCSFIPYFQPAKLPSSQRQLMVSGVSSQRYLCLL